MIAALVREGYDEQTVTEGLEAGEPWALALVEKPVPISAAAIHLSEDFEVPAPPPEPIPNSPEGVEYFWYESEYGQERLAGLIERGIITRREGLALFYYNFHNMGRGLGYDLDALTSKRQRNDRYHLFLDALKQSNMNRGSIRTRAAFEAYCKRALAKIAAAEGKTEE